MEKVIFNNKGGIGIILKLDEDILDYAIEVPVVLHGMTLKPNELTDLDGMFAGKVKYIGLLKETNTFDTMVFSLIDNTGTLDYKYYQCFYRITETRIANKYKENTLRDFQWKEGKWK